MEGRKERAHGNDLGRFLTIGDGGDGNSPVGSGTPKVGREKVVSPCFEGVV